MKPENLLLRSKAHPLEVVLSDFGSAVRFGSRSQGLHNQHQSEANECEIFTKVVGTASYVAPEVLRKRYMPAPADMWSAGMTLFILLAGDPAYDGAHTDLVIHRILTTPIVIPLSISKRRSWLCQHFLLSLLRRRPSDRLSPRAALEHPWIVSVGSNLPGSHSDMSLPEIDAPQDEEGDLASTC